MAIDVKNCKTIVYDMTLKELKDTVEKILTHSDGVKDMIIDCRPKKYLQSPEFGIIVRAASSLKNAGKKLFIICNKEVQQLIHLTSIPQIPNVKVIAR